jgi:flagellum-specific peptidoglycan hydrolase FlgJ
MKKIIFTLSLFTTVQSQTLNEVWNYAYHLGIKHHDIVMAQVILESKHLKSDIFKNNNNLIGMKLATQRPTTAIGKDANGFAIYENWKWCLRDYLIYQNKYYKDDSEDYYEFLTRMGYDEKGGYGERLKEIVWKLWSC